MEVKTVVGGYVVAGTLSRPDPQHYLVGKDKSCSCGAGPGCAHVAAVAAYLRRGGARAPQASGGMECPICGGQTALLEAGPGLPFWRCLADPGHYWLWRGEQGGVKSFLTRAHPGKRGAFYAQTPEQREALLSAAEARMCAGGYVPWR